MKNVKWNFLRVKEAYPALVKRIFYGGYFSDIDYPESEWYLINQPSTKGFESPNYVSIMKYEVVAYYATLLKLLTARIKH